MAEFYLAIRPPCKRQADGVQGFMKIITAKLEGHTTFKEDTELQGMVVGSANVVKGVTLVLLGTINGKLFLEGGSTVYLRGTVNGDVENTNGHLEVYGVVNGRVSTEAGFTKVFSGAIVDGVQA
jgi:hypothetical protein